MPILGQDEVRKNPKLIVGEVYKLLNEYNSHKAGEFCGRI